MKCKRLGGYVALLIGVVLFYYGLYGSYKMIEARRDIERKTQDVPGGGFRGYVQEHFEGEVDKYAVPVVLCYIGGIVFLVGGYILTRNHKKKR
ncbi:MAG: hypothetical protein HRU43_02180 [Simkaniaceae bacterium]|nr:hypothetical protein [Simkaniaceae bacterium]